jgi:hypothetical protein
MSAAGHGEVTVMRFARWADANPAAAREVETIMRVFGVARRVACRWRRALRESLRHAPAPINTGRHDLALGEIDPGTSEYVAASLRHAARGVR